MDVSDCKPVVNDIIPGKELWVVYRIMSDTLKETHTHTHKHIHMYVNRWRQERVVGKKTGARSSRELEREGVNRIIKHCIYRAGEMAQWLRTLAVLPEDLGSIPSTHMTANNCL